MAWGSLSASRVLLRPNIHRIRALRLHARLSASHYAQDHWFQRTTPPVFRPVPRLPLLRFAAVVRASMSSASAIAPRETNGSGPTDPKLYALRAAMAAWTCGDGVKGVDAYIVPSEDAHMSEYAPDCDNRRAFISGFTGSAGTAVVAKEAAALWTDGRYFLQAEQQLGPQWTLMRGGVQGTPEISEWLIQQVPEGGRVGIDPFLHTIEAARKLKAELEAKGRYLVPIYGGNLVDGVWGSDRPAAPTAPLEVHPLKWAGVGVQEKLAKLQEEVSSAGGDALLMTMLDEVAWCLNLRGADVKCNPVFVSYALLNRGRATLYVEAAKITEEAAAHLKEAGVGCKQYEDLLEEVKALAASGSRIVMDPAKVSYAISQAALDAAKAGGNGEKGLKRKAPGSDGVDEGNQKPMGGASPVVEVTSPVSMAKAIKNEAEMAGMQEAHLRDGVAVAKFMCWLDKLMASGGTLTEVEVDEKITGLRAQQPGFKQPSFDTIAGEGPNGAIIHYRATKGSCRTVTPNSVLLVDSGGQYDCGTTDVTRTLHTGTPTDHQIATFTAVLQGHIALASAVFPPGTPGIAIDALARVPLWNMGLNYRHGTGHGVGAALNVHEGPHSVSTRYYNTTPLKTGMITSNEPGYYENGSFGIRIENLMQIVDVDTPFQFANERYMGFSELTLIPIQRKLINIHALLEKEILWVDRYHERVWKEISPRLGDDEETRAWLKDATAPLKAVLAA